MTRTSSRSLLSQVRAEQGVETSAPTCLWNCPPSADCGWHPWSPICTGECRECSRIEEQPRSLSSWSGPSSLGSPWIPSSPSLGRGSACSPWKQQEMMITALSESFCYAAGFLWLEENYLLYGLSCLYFIAFSPKMLTLAIILLATFSI